MNQVFHVQAQNTKIVGKVIDAEMKHPLPSANIELLHAEDSSLIMGTISKTNGTYQFENFPFGQYFIRLSYMYFQQKTAKRD
jgi:hypothetical protein